MNRRAFFLAASVSALSLCGAVAQAQDFPTRPITLVVPYTAGGSADITARTLAEYLKVELGQPVIVENKPGAGTMLAAEHVAKAAPDGYTILMSGSSVVVAPVLNESKRYDPIKSFVAIGGIATIPHLLVVPTSTPAKSVSELIAYLKANPTAASYASVGMGATNHLEGELFRTLSGTQATHIPYKGSAPALVDLLAGRTQFMFDAYSSSKPFIDEGKLRVLGISSGKRSASMPQFPTVAEAGLPGFDTTPWLGITAPAGTPKPVAERLNLALVKALDAPALRARFKELGMDIMEFNQSQFERFVEGNSKVWIDIIKGANIRIQ